MTLKEVIENLNRTIEGKRYLLERVEDELVCRYIRMNIDELARIRDDLLKIEA